MKKALLILCFILFNFSSVSAQQEFEEYPSNPVFKYSGTSGSFDQMRIYSHDVVKVDGEYWMYYTGVGNGNSTQIGLATSNDGINWERYSSSPVFTCSDNTTSACGSTNSWSSFRVGVVSVEYENGLFRMWYFGNNQSNGSIYELGYATSLNGIDWQPSPSNPVFTANGLDAVLYVNVMKVGDIYRQYYTDVPNEDFYYIESADGIDWSAAPVKISDGIVHSVEKVDEKYLAIEDTEVFVSDNGIDFELSTPSATILNNSNPDQAKVVSILEGDVLKTWRVHYLGNEIWRYGNFGINYSTIDNDKLRAPIEKNPYLLYTQITSPYPSESQTATWSNDPYADGVEYSCGSTIAGCGCAITSLVMAGRNHGVVTDVLGDDVNPKNMNAYLQSIGGYNSAGSVFWLAAQSYLGEFTQNGKFASKFQYQGMYANSQTMSAIDSALTESPHAVLGYKNGHFVWLPEKTVDSYIVRDPNWYDTLTANDVVLDVKKQRDYNNLFDSARVYDVLSEPVEFNDDGVEAYVRGTAELLYRNAAGEKVGFDDGSILLDLEYASYGNTEPVSLDGIPANINAGKHLLVSDSDKEFTIEVIGTAVGEFTLEFFTIDKYGEVTTFDFSGLTFPGVTTSFTFNLETGEVSETEIDYAQFLLIMDVLLADATPQEQKFFQKWAEKIYGNIENKTVSQALQSIEVFGKLLKAKKVDSPSFISVLDKLSIQIQ